MAQRLRTEAIFRVSLALGRPQLASNRRTFFDFGLLMGPICRWALPQDVSGGKTDTCRIVTDRLFLLHMTEHDRES